MTGISPQRDQFMQNRKISVQSIQNANAAPHGLLMLKPKNPKNDDLRYLQRMYVHVKKAKQFDYVDKFHKRQNQDISVGIDNVDDVHET